MNKGSRFSLKTQLFSAVFISFAIGIMVFGVSFFTGNAILNKTIYGHTFVQKTTTQQFYKLQHYVKENSVSKETLQRVNVWCSRGDKVYLTIYDGDSLIFKSREFSGYDNMQNTERFDPETEDPDNEYILELSDGTKVRAFLYYYAGDIFYFAVTALSGVLAFIAFSVCFIMFINRKMEYITILKKELDILSSGQLDYQVTVSGIDELGELASGIDQMRRSILKHQEIENQIRSANSQLITAMSHDLRTPLTSLLAYLEIVQRQKYTDDDQRQLLIKKCVAQTMRIKDMADKLFEYFLAYATEWESANMETVDADGLFQQLLGDYVYALESRGLQVQTEIYPLESEISVNTELLHRAMDNIYSNLIKYANPNESIRISCKRNEDKLMISISNGVRNDEIKSESTGIGLITCRRIIEYHKGKFLTFNTDGRFQVGISLPLGR